MKNYIFLIIFTILFNHAQSQELGIKIGSSLIENNSTLNKPINIGIYYNNKISNKINVSISYLYSQKKQKNVKMDFQTNYNGHNVILDFLYNINIKKNYKVKFGLGTGYVVNNITSQGIVLNWINTIEYRYIPSRLIFGIEYKSIFNTPISIEILATPSYLFNIHQKSDAIMLSDTNTDLKMFSINLGLKYLIGKQ